MKELFVLFVILCTAFIAYADVTNSGFDVDSNAGNGCDITPWVDCSNGTRTDNNPPCDGGLAPSAQCYAGQSNGNPGTAPHGIYQNAGTATAGSASWSVKTAGGDLSTHFTFRYYTADPTCSNICSQGTILATDDNSCGGGWATQSGNVTVPAGPIYVGTVLCGAADWDAEHWYSDDVVFTLPTGVEDWALY